MARITMVCVGKKDGLAIYSAMGAEDERHINEQQILVVDMKSGKSKRTGLQNSSLYLYFTWLAKALNNAGYGVVSVLKILAGKEDIPWSSTLVKERLFSPVQQHTFGTDSTTKLDTDQVSIVYEALNRTTGEKLGVSVSFPDKFMKMYEDDLKNGK